MINTALQGSRAVLLTVCLTVVLAGFVVTGVQAKDSARSSKATEKRQTPQRYLAWFKTHKVMVGTIIFPGSIKSGSRPVVALNYPLSNFGHPWTYQVRVRLDRDISARQMSLLRKFHEKNRYGMTLYVVITGDRGNGYEYTGSLLGYGTWPRRQKNRVMRAVNEFDFLDINSQVFRPLIE